MGQGDEKSHSASLFSGYRRKGQKKSRYAKEGSWRATISKLQDPHQNLILSQRKKNGRGEPSAKLGAGNLRWWRGAKPGHSSLSQTQTAFV